MPTLSYHEFRSSSMRMIMYKERGNGITKSRNIRALKNQASINYEKAEDSGPPWSSQARNSLV